MKGFVSRVPMEHFIEGKFTPPPPSTLLQVM